MGNNVNTDEIMVTIECSTYNHVKYIRDMLDGILMQKTNFRFNVFIFDDFSTDGTSSIIKDYVDKYPDIFYLFIPPYNTFSRGEWRKWFKKLKLEKFHGKYGCWCEGDDYWTDPYKLQIQFDFMESHPDVSLTAHASNWLNFEDETSEEYHPYNGDRYLTPEEIIMPPIGILSSATVMAKKEVFFYDDRFPTADTADYRFQLHALTKGKVYYFDRVMSVYRYRTEGSWTRQTEKDHEKFLSHTFSIISMLQKFNDYTEKKYAQPIMKRSNWWLCRCAFLNSSLCSDEFELIMKNVFGNEQSSNVHAMRAAYRLLSGVFDMTEKEKATIQLYKKIVVLGIGDYPKHIADNLNHNEIDFCGYVETDFREPGKNFNGKPVWKMKDYPYDWNDTFIVIGGVWKREEEIVPELKKYGCEHFFAPLWNDLLGQNS